MKLPRLAVLPAILVRLVGLVGLVGPAASVFLGCPVAVAADDSDDAVIARGVALRKEGDDQAASELFMKVYQRSHTARAAGQLGLAEQALGRWEEAESHLREALRSPDDPWVKKNHDALSRDMLLIKSHIARVEIVGDPEGAEILINGRAVGTLPLSGPISTSAGSVDIEARAPGFRHEMRTVNLTGGQYQRLVMRLQKDEPAPTATATATPLPPAPIVSPPPSRPTPGSALSPPAATRPSGDESPSHLRPIAEWTALGLAGAGLAVGITSSVVRANKLNQFNSTDNGRCVEMSGRAVDADGNPVPACQGLLDSYKSMRTWQIVGFVSAGVLAATWLTLFLTEPSAAAQPRGGLARGHALVCAPTADPTGAGATCMFTM